MTPLPIHTRPPAALAALAAAAAAAPALPAPSAAPPQAGTQRYPIFHSHGGRAAGTMEWRGNGVRDGAYRASFRGTVQDMLPNFRCAYAFVVYQQPYFRGRRVRFFYREDLAGQACGFTS